MNPQFSQAGFRLGQDAFDQGKGWNDNPYQKDSAGWRSWRRGFGSRKGRDKE